MNARTFCVKGGNSIATRKDVAYLAGVSEATVSRVFNDTGPLREATKSKVLKAAKALNYHPNAIAQSFAKGRSGNIGVIVPYISKVHLFSTHYFSEILSGIGMKLGEAGYGLLLLFQSPEAPKSYVQLFQSQKVDGCIILGAKDNPEEVEAISTLERHQLPYCLVNQSFMELDLHTIDAQHYEGSFQAVSLLLGKGFKRIAFLNGPMEYSNSKERFVGYQAALRASGIEPLDKWLFQGNYSRKSGYQAAVQIQAVLSEIDAIFAANDRMALGLMQGLNDFGLTAGRDYALMGYDDSDAARLTHPPLSSVRVPFFEMGCLAAQHVLEMLSSGNIHRVKERLPIEIVERASTQVNT
jgi:LacI family transcriptional regulator